MNERKNTVSQRPGQPADALVPFFAKKVEKRLTVRTGVRAGRGEYIRKR